MCALASICREHDLKDCLKWGLEIWTQRLQYAEVGLSSLNSRSSIRCIVSFQRGGFGYVCMHAEATVTRVIGDKGKYAQSMQAQAAYRESVTSKDVKRVVKMCRCSHTLPLHKEKLRHFGGKRAYTVVQLASRMKKEDQLEVRDLKVFGIL